MASKYLDARSQCPRKGKMELAMCPVSIPDNIFPERFTHISGETKREVRRTGKEGRFLSGKEGQGWCLAVSSPLVFSSALGRQ